MCTNDVYVYWNVTNKVGVIKETCIASFMGFEHCSTREELLEILRKKLSKEEAIDDIEEIKKDTEEKLQWYNNRIKTIDCVLKYVDNNSTCDVLPGFYLLDASLHFDV